MGCRTLLKARFPSGNPAIFGENLKTGGFASPPHGGFALDVEHKQRSAAHRLDVHSTQGEKQRDNQAMERDMSRQSSVAVGDDLPNSWSVNGEFT